MQYYPIGGYTVIGGVEVPVMAGGGKHLDWRKKKGDKAPLLQSPYGWGHFKIGGSREGDYVVLDYAELPDKQFMINMAAPESMGFHCEDNYSFFLRDDLLSDVYYKLTKIIDRLQEFGIEHDAEAHGADWLYYLRAIGKELNAPVYLSMNDNALRFGSKK